jgi:hypothetical protein
VRQTVESVDPRWSLGLVSGYSCRCYHLKVSTFSYDHSGMYIYSCHPPKYTEMNEAFLALLDHKVVLILLGSLDLYPSNIVHFWSCVLTYSKPILIIRMSDGNVASVLRRPSQHSTNARLHPDQEHPFATDATTLVHTHTPPEMQAGLPMISVRKGSTSRFWKRFTRKGKRQVGVIQSLKVLATFSCEYGRRIHVRLLTSVVRAEYLHGIQPAGLGSPFCSGMGTQYSAVVVEFHYFHL